MAHHVQLTEKQASALRALAKGPGLMPIIHFGKLKELDLVESAKDDINAAQRGYAAAKLTHAGKKLVA